MADGVGRHHVQDDRVADVALPPRGKGRGKKKAAMTQITQPPLPGVRRAAGRADLRPESLPRSGAASQRTAAGQQPWCACHRSWQDEERAGRQDPRRSRDHGDRIRGLGVFLIPYPLGSQLVSRDGTDLPGCGSRRNCCPSSWPSYTSTSRSRCCDDQLNSPCAGDRACTRVSGQRTQVMPQATRRKAPNG